MPAREHKSLQLYKRAQVIALSSATGERTSSTIQRDTTRQPTTHGVGLTKPFFERGRAILVKRFGPIIPYMSEKI